MLKSAQWIAAISVVALFVSLAVISYYSSPPSGQPREQQTSTQAEAENQGEKQHSLRGFIRFMFPDAISIFTFWLTLATIGLGIVAVLQIGFLDRSETIASRSANAAKQSADVAKDTLIATQRPWMWPETLAVASDLVFKEDRSATISIRYIIKNMGNTPALNVWPELKLFPFFWGKVEGEPPNFTNIVPQTMVSKDLRDWCRGNAERDEQAAKADWVHGEPVFPGKTLSSGINGLTMQAGSAENRTQMSGGEVVPILYFCVTYRFPADEKSHYTGQAFMVMRADPSADGGARAINPAEGSIPAAEVRLIPQPFGSGSAN